MMNLFMEPMPTVLYAQQEQNVDLLRTVYITMLRCRLTGTLTVAGGAADGTLAPLAPAGLIESLRVMWENQELVGGISGDDWVRLTRRMVAQTPEFTGPANAGVQTGTAFAVEFHVPFARPWLANPYETVLPPLPVRQQLKVLVRWATGRTTAASDPGTGAIIRGGDRTVTLANVKLDIVQEYGEKPFTPWYLPVITVRQSDNFAAAVNPLPLRLLFENRFDSVFLITRDGANSDPATRINTVSLVSGTRRFMNNVPRAMLENRERNLFPGAPSDAAEPGTLFLPFADGGKLTNVVNPAQLRAQGSDPRFEFDVSAPTAPAGFVRAIIFELQARRGLTQIQE